MKVCNSHVRDIIGLLGARFPDMCTTDACMNGMPLMSKVLVTWHTGADVNYPENVILGSENKVNSHRIERTYLVFFLQVFFSLSVRHSEKTITYLLHFPCAYHAQTRILVTDINMNFSSECNSLNARNRSHIRGRKSSDICTCWRLLHLRVICYCQSKRKCSSDMASKSAPGRHDMSVILVTGSYDHEIRFWEAWSGICSRTIARTGESGVSWLHSLVSHLTSRLSSS